MLVDTHAHIHFSDYKSDLDSIFKNAQTNDVGAIITVGTNEVDSIEAVQFVKDHQLEPTKLYATVGLHPHDAKDYSPKIIDSFRDQINSNRANIVAVGECGLDYFRNHSSREEQAKALRSQLELASEVNLPLVFHVRDAWDDFFRILADYPVVRGVIHSFTGGPTEVEKGVKANLYFALNGIITFTKLDSQIEAARLIPADKLLLETDCPFLTPQPMRGKRNEPANLTYIASHIAKLRHTDTASFIEQTTQNAVKMFGIAK